MPIYEYQCSECGVHFDRLQRLGEPQPNTCPNGHPRVHRLFSQPAIIFKGSGFYATDHGRNGYTSSPSKPQPAKDPKAVASQPREDTSS